MIVVYDFDIFSIIFEDLFFYLVRLFGNDVVNIVFMGNLGGLGVDLESCYNGNYGGVEGLFFL